MNFDAHSQPLHDVTPATEPGQVTSVQELVSNWSLVELVEQTHVLEQQGAVEQACVAYLIWLRAGRYPQMAHVALFNLGALQQTLGQWAAAQASYTQCLENAPFFGQAYINLGLLQERCGQNDAALQTWSRYLGQRMLKSQPDTELQCTALNHIGRVQEGRKRYDLAEKALEDSLRLKPDQAGVIQHWVHIRQKACRWPVFAELADLPLGKVVRSTSPLAMLALTDDPQLQLLTSQGFVHRTYAMQEGRLHDPTRRPGARWRVGLVSADFREHAVGFLLPAFLHGTDRQAYELYAYDYTRDENTALRQQLLDEFDQVRPIAGLTDQEAAQQIAADQIDILIDLHGLSSGARPGIFALHPAPHQVTYLGYIGSTGMPWFDYVLVDPWVMPTELTPHFTEKPLYLSRSFIPLTHEVPTEQTVTRAMVRLPENAFVMAAFGNVYKITPEMFDSWLKLLKRIPAAILWLLDDNPVTTQALRAHAQERGGDLDRIVFAQRCDPRQFRAQLRLADVYLDTYPYNCGSTSNDVVNAGVPLVSRYGRTLVSRMGLSILNDLGRPDLAVADQQSYEDKVLEVALRTRSGHRYAYEHRPVSGLLQQALDGIRYGRTLDHAPKPATKAEPRLQLTSALSTRPSRIESDLPSWIESQWHGFDQVFERLVHQTLDAQSLYWLDQGSLPCAATVRALQQALAGSRAQAVIASPGWDVHSLHLNPLMLVGQRQPQWLDWAQNFLERRGFSVRLQDWCLPVERSVAGLSLACHSAIWFDWLDLALQLRSLHAQELIAGGGFRVADSLHLTHAQLLYPWLMSLVLERRQSKMASLDVFAQPALHAANQAQMPLAVQGAALKSAFHQTGQMRYKKAFVQLTQHQGLALGLSMLNTPTEAKAPQTAA